jgi:hypothetical protein
MVVLWLLYFGLVKREDLWMNLPERIIALKTIREFWTRPKQ